MNIPPEVFGLPTAEDGAESWLDVSYIDTLSPIAAGTAPADLQGILDGYKALLFDTPDQDQAPRNTYAILDAAVCGFLPELLDTSDLPHRCLFTGKVQEDTGDAAPWLVQLEPDHRLTRMLVSTSERPGGLWDAAPGIIIKSNLDLDAVWTHCRKFTRLQDAEGKWLFYRFWSATVSTRVMSLGNRPELISFVSPFFPATDCGFEVLLTNADLQARLFRKPGTHPTPQRPVLTAAVHNTIRQVRRAQQYETLIDITLRHVQGLTTQDEVEIRHNLRIKRDWYFATGFWQRDHLAKLLVWEVLLGPDFIDTYAEGTIRAIISSAKQAYEAVMNIEYFLQAQETRRERAQTSPQMGDRP